MSAISGGCAGATDFSDFDAVTVNRSGSFELDMRPQDAFPLFTAQGEALWARGWLPFILTGDGYEEGTVWVTTGHGHTTYWYVAVCDTVELHLRYVRVTPEVNTGTVDVRVGPNGTGGSEVHVTYRLTGLSGAGNAGLESSFSESGYAQMMEHWRRAINENRARIEEHLGL